MTSQTQGAGRLAGRRILITGGGTGIGAATALRFAKEGARVAVLGLDLQGVADLPKAALAHAAVVDLRDPDALWAAVDESARRLGGLDGLVCNAGVGPSKPFAETTLDDWRNAIDGNATVTFMTCHAALPHLERCEQATIVNVGSAVGVQPLKGRSAYAASKAAVHAFTKVLAMELAPRIRCNVIAPGAVDTALSRGVMTSPDAVKLVASRYALQRLGEAHEIAEAILFLTSFESSFVTGATLSVDGGRTYY
jgi:NAD(P)-dependent dehydrogenase (short-subunit alcohol dehydrogenase family)